MPGEYVDVTTEDLSSFSGYLAIPEGGRGPGLVLLQEIFGINDYLRKMAERYAEEGYVVIVPDLFWRLEPNVDLGYGSADFVHAMDLLSRFDVDAAIRDVASAVTALRSLAAHEGGVGAIGYCLGGKLAALAAARVDVDCAISYYGVGVHEVLDDVRLAGVPMMFHFAENDTYCPPDAQAKIRSALAAHSRAEFYFYPGADHAFATVSRDTYDRSAAEMAYSRTLAMLRGVLGPSFDLNALWDQHTEYEFAQRDVSATMSTMVSEPYVNHIPTLTGGVGFGELSRFYKYHFVDANPADTKLIPVSRTVGADRVVDEMVLAFTHDKEIDWLLPGVPPTGRYVEVPLVAIVNFRGGKLYHEHIYWDQASVLVQIGLLSPADLPIAGIEQTRKLLDQSLPSNELMRNWSNSAGWPAP
jgi:carboxymethylenebutenolidase